MLRDFVFLAATAADAVRELFADLMARLDERFASALNPDEED